MNPTSFPNLDMPMVDPQTGKITKAWYQLIVSLYLLLGGSDPISTPDLGVQAGQMDENFAATIEAENNLEALRRALTMDDALHARLAELKAALDAVVNSSIDGHTARMAELDKRLNALEVQDAFQARPDTHSLTGSTATAAPAAGTGAALPATPAGYLTLTINGKPQQLPYY